MADPFIANRQSDKQFLRISTKTAGHDDFIDYDTSDTLHSASSFSSRLSRSPIPAIRHGTTTTTSVRQCSKSPLPNARRSSRENRTPRLNANETELKQKIQALEGTVAEYERQKYNVMDTFAEYRERVSERERKLEAEYSSKIITLSEEVLAAKKDFEERMKQFQALQEKFEREKELALEKLREEHQREIEQLEQRCSENQLLNLEQKYVIEIQRLEDERKSLRTEKEKLSETYESKLWRAQSLYESSLNAAKSLYSNEIDALKDHENALRDELLGRQEEFRDRLEEMHLHLQQSKEELAKCESEMSALEERLRQKEKEVQAISIQLEQARKETEEAFAKLNGVENQLETTRQKYQEQEEQLRRKADVLAALEAAKNQLEEVILDLQSELKSLKGKVTFLENERQSLESQSQTQAKLQNSQLQALEMVLDNLSKEKQVLKDHYEQQLEHERISAEERDFVAKKEYTSKLNELEKQHKIHQEQLENKFLLREEQLRNRLESEFEQRRRDFDQETDRIKQELQEIISKSERSDAGELKTMMDEVLQKTQDIKETELQQQLEDALATVQKQKQLLNNQQKHQCNFETTHRREIENLTRTIEKKIRDTLDKEASESGQARSRDFVEKQVFEAQLTQARKEHHAELVKSKAKIVELQKTVEALEAKMKYEDERRQEAAHSETSGSNEMLEEELSGMKKQLTESADRHSATVSQLRSQIDEQKVQLEAMAAKEKSIRDEIEKEFKDKQEGFASTSAKSAQEFEKLQKRNRELQKELEKKEKENEQKIQRVSNESLQKAQQVETMNQRLNSLTSELENTNKELERKTQEMLHIRNETHGYIRKREQQQSKAHKLELETLKAEHKALLQIHENAQAEMKAERDSLQNKLIKLQNSSAEDTNEQSEIDRLREQLQSNEETIRKIENEKQALKSQLDLFETRSQFSSPIGSMDSLKKRDSISSVCSAKEAQPMCRRAVNTAIIKKWHCLVEQVQKEHAVKTQKSSSYTSLHHQSKHFTHGAIALNDDKSPSGSRQDLDKIDDETDSTKTERQGRCTHRHAANALKPPESRSTAKSPSRSPIPKPKNATGKRPAWRL